MWPCNSQSAVLLCSSLMWCVVVYRLHLCGPDNAVSLIILCQKTVLIMGHYPHRPPAPSQVVSQHLSQSYLREKKTISNDKLTALVGSTREKKGLFFSECQSGQHRCPYYSVTECSTTELRFSTLPGKWWWPWERLRASTWLISWHPGLSLVNKVEF